MKPSARFLILAVLATGATGLAVSVGGLAPLIPWAVLAAAAVLDLALSAAPRLSARLEGASHLICGESRPVEIGLDRPAPAGLTLAFDWGEGVSGPEVMRVEPGADGIGVEIFARVRGEWPSPAAIAAWPSRFKLWVFAPRLDLGAPIAVLPDIRPASSGEIDLKVRAALDGQKENHSEGEGSEFHQLRDHAPGESLRRVDWKRSARQRRLLIKETRAERNHNVVLAIDAGYLMREEIDGLAKIDHAVNAVLALAWAAAVGGDKVGFYAYDSRPRAWLPPEPGRAMFPKLRRALAGLSYEDRESNPTLGLATLGDRLRRRSLVVVCSDFVDTTTSELMLEQLSHLSKRHLIVFVALRDPGAEAEAAAPAQDLSGAAAALAARDWTRERRIVLDRMARLGVMVLDSAPRDLTARLVSTYLDLKIREAA
ncbi:MAG: DUF58 domain-containing protein [Alphaproteobacteria bacterium]|nr:DUF58 domain-containing protein [Alphaproteobacteria bacterium]